MAFNQKFKLSFALILATSFLLTESAVTTTTKFDSYTGIIEKLQEEQAAESFVPKDLIDSNARLLAETLNNSNSQDVLQFRAELFANYSINILNAIFEQAIDIVYSIDSTDMIYNYLNNVDSNLPNINTERAYHVRVNWTLYLYWKFLAHGDVNDQFVYNTAQAIHDLRRHSMYKRINRDNFRRLDKAFNTLTSSLRHLFNTTEICLENKNFPSYYLYFPVKSIGDNVLKVQAVLTNSYFGYSSWLNIFAATMEPAIPNQFYLMNSHYGWLLYRHLANHDVIVQIDNSVPANRWWTPTLWDDTIMFENSGYYMCATTEYNNSLQGFNIKAVQPRTLDDPLCQWMISDCTEIRG